LGRLPDKSKAGVGEDGVMTDRTCAAALTAFADAIAARDWAALRALLSDDCTTTLLHTGELLDADAFVAFNSSYPGDWIYTRDEIVDGGDRAVLRSRTVIDGQTWHAATFVTVNSEGLLTDIVEVWTDAVGPHPDR